MMNNNEFLRRRAQRGGLVRTLIASMIGAALMSATPVFAQSTTGSIFGQTGEGGQTVIIQNQDTGLVRRVSTDASGRYRALDLPPGHYTVTVEKAGSAVAKRENVNVTIAGGSEVSFVGAAATEELSTITVTGGAQQAIDVSQVDTRSVFTASDLQRISVTRNIASVALLAPSVVRNASYIDDSGNTIPSFGGSASSENAYYINGFPITNPLTSLGSTTLAFDSISQMQVLTGGYGAEYGRATGGVINIVTKRGTNTWKAGVYTSWSPVWGRASPHNLYYPDTGYYGPDRTNPNLRTDGTLYSWRKDNNSWQFLTGLYAGGAIIQDKLFVYANAEMTQRDGRSVNQTRLGAISNNGWSEYGYDYPRWTGKVDWHITDNHLVEFSAISDVTKFKRDGYTFDYADLSPGTTKLSGYEARDDARLYIGKYTGYLTDDLTLSALWGNMRINHTNQPWNYDPDCPRISAGATARIAGFNYTSCQTQTAFDGPGRDEVKGGRFDVGYRLGDHDLRIGYELSDATSSRHHDGYAGNDGYIWVYSFTENPTQPINASLGVGAPAGAGGFGDQGYYVRSQRYSQYGTVTTEQRAQYVEDRWQFNDNLLFQLGLRNEQFTNYTGAGQPYISQRHQLAPRLGASWDLHGDSTLKLFANAGRYHLALPNNVALRAASGSYYTQEYFTYTGTDPVTGAPTGLNHIPVTNLGYNCPGSDYVVSANLECGDSPNPLTVAAKDIRSHFQDEFIVGMQQQLWTSWNWGAKATYRTLRSAIDDTCAPVLHGGCFIFNPGVDNTFYEEQDDGTLKPVHYTAAELGLPKLKRRYYAIDLMLEHEFTDDWYGKIEYTFSRNWGNTEGQLASDLDTGGGGQTDVSVTQDWDLPQLMVNASGVLPNHRKHQFKVFGYYQLNPEWRFGGSAIIASGRPVNCTSYYPTADRGLYNGSFYYFCGLAGSGNDPSSPNYVPPSSDYAPSPRGSHGTTPWTYTFNVNVAWQPAWLDNLTVQADVFNLFNQQVPGMLNPNSASSRTERGQLYRQKINYGAPRSVQFTLRYDF